MRMDDCCRTAARGLFGSVSRDQHRSGACFGRLGLPEYVFDGKAWYTGNMRLPWQILPCFLTPPPPCAPLQRYSPLYRVNSSFILRSTPV